MDRRSAGAVASAQRADAFADKINAMSLIQALPDGPLDIVGDIHGEFDALRQLIRHLGYDMNGAHPDGRTLVFVGDFCDRGPDSPAVLALALRWIESGRAVAVLGNHEINLLREDAKDGSGWYFDERIARDNEKYAPYRRMDLAQRDATLALLSRLPIALERDDLRVIHAAWCEPQIGMARQLAPGSVRREYDHWEQEADRKALETRLGERMRAERVLWPHDLEDGSRKPPFLSAHAENESNKQMLNPLKVLTSGVERKGGDPFFAGGKWRFVERVAWWNEYDDRVPVVMGHYWRRVHALDRSALGKGDQDLFKGISPFAWHGRHGNVFCVDYSVGARWTARRKGQAPERDFKLAALRWPERELQFDDGTRHATTHFGEAIEPASA
jgi:hypothetical protein